MFKKSGTKTPRVEVAEIGPSIDLIVRRTSLASDDLYKEACRQPKAAKVIASFQSFSRCTLLMVFWNKMEQINILEALQISADMNMRFSTDRFN